MLRKVKECWQKWLSTLRRWPAQCLLCLRSWSLGNVSLARDRSSCYLSQEWPDGNSSVQKARPQSKHRALLCQKYKPLKLLYIVSPWIDFPYELRGA